MDEIGMVDAAPADRPPFWQAVSCREPIRLEAADRAPRLRRWRLGDCELMALPSSPALVLGEAGRLDLAVQRAGRGTVATAGRTCELAEGGFLLLDPAQPARIEFGGPLEVLILRVPLARVEERVPSLRAMAGEPMRGDTGPGALFSLLVRAAGAQLTAGEPATDALAEVIWPLLALAYAGDRSRAPDPSPKDERRRALLSMVEQQLCDPGLDVHRIARRMGVSARYVQMLFAELGTTPTAYIQRQRLDRAGHRLEREGARCSVTAVAFDVGFNDLSSFCRAFRRRFDVAPREYRAGLRGRPALSS